MKKWLLHVALLFLVAAFYIMVPDKTSVAVSGTVQSNPNGVFRLLQDSSSLKKWWPGQIENDSMVLNGTVFKRARVGFQLVEFLVRHDNVDINAVLRIVPLSMQSTGLEWSAVAPEGGAQPFKRWKTHQTANTIKDNLRHLTDSLKRFLERAETVYGMKITQEKVTDTILIYTNTSLDHYPSTTEIYTLVNRLQQHATQHQANATNAPMLHIEQSSGKYEVMVALPVDRRLPQQDNIQLRLMIAGKILVGEVKGGQATVEKAFRQMEYYITDYHKTRPAIPFFSLVSDRTAVADTSQWITRIYYPVM